jgi:AhpD family alkylhydroperoxidase
MDKPIYPPSSYDLSNKRQELAPENEKAFHAFSRQVFADGALPSRTKQIVAVAVAHVTQCPYCIRSHTKAAMGAGVRPEELMEAIWVAAEMRAGAAYAHATIAMAAMEEAEQPSSASK